MPRMHDVSTAAIAQFRQGLLKWYDQNQRSLPWRDIAANEEDNNVKAYAGKFFFVSILHLAFLPNLNILVLSILPVQ